MADDWDALALEVKAETEAQSVKRNLTGALDVNPDKQAEINRLSEKSGVPTFSIDSPENEAWVRSMTRMNDLNPDEMVKTHPMTAKALQDENFAKIAHDDVENIKNLEDSFSRIGKTPSSTVDEVLAMTEKQAAYAGYLMMAYGPEGQDIDAMAEFVAGRNRSMADVQARAPDYQRNFQKRLAEADGWLESAGVIATSPRAVGRSAISNIPNMFLPTLTSVAGAKIGAASGAGIGAGIATAVGQAGPQVAVPEEVATVPAGAAIGATIGGIGGGVTGGFAGGMVIEVASWIDQEMSDAGIDVTDSKAIAEKFRDPDFMEAVKNRAEAKGLTTAGIDALWNATFAGRFAKGMTAVGSVATKEGAKTLTKNVGKAAGDVAVGAVGESVSEAGGQLAATGKVDAGDVLMEGFSSLGQSVFDTKMYSDIRKGDVDKAAKAVAEQKLAEVQGVHDAAMKVKLVQRDPAAVRAMVEAANPDSRVYIDGAVATKYFQELDAPTKALLTDAIPDIEERIAEANLSGTDVMLNRSDYVAYIASNEGGKVVMEHVKFDRPDDLTVAQLTDPNYLESLYDLSPKDKTPLTDIEAFREELTNKLRDSGRIGTQQIARESVAPLASFVQTMRERGGSEAVTQSLLQGIDVQGPVSPFKSTVDITDKTINDMREYKTRTDTLFNAREKSLGTRREKAKAKAKAEGRLYVEPKGRSGKPKRHLPVLKYIAQSGGVKVGSPLAGELKNMDVTPKTAPWLFVKEDKKTVTAQGVVTQKALSDLDGIDSQDINETIGLDVFRNSGTSSTDKTGYYVDSQDILDAIDSELRENPVVPEATDPMEAAFEDFNQYLESLGLSLDTATNEQIKKALNDPAAFLGDGVANETADADGDFNYVPLDVRNTIEQMGGNNIVRFVRPTGETAFAFIHTANSASENSVGKKNISALVMNKDGTINRRIVWAEGQNTKTGEAGWGRNEAGTSPVNFNSNSDAMAAMPADYADGMTYNQDGTANTDTEAFKKWAGENHEIVEPDDINDHSYDEEKPYILKVFHGTTHDFDSFNAGKRGQKEGQFGAVNYFTSSYDDADQNYTADGHDLTNRIELRAERLADDMRDNPEDYGLTDESDFQSEARVLAEKEIKGENPQVLEVFVKTEKPFIVGGDSQKWIQIIDNDEIESLAIDRVSESNGITVDEVRENIDDYQDEIDEARWEIEADTETELYKAIERVSNESGIDAQELYGSLSDTLADGEISHTQLEEALRSSETLMYAEDPETGALQGYDVLARIIQELGFDSIILKNAGDRFKNMQMSDGVAHVHVFDANNTNIKSVNNRGTFDPNDPRILYQSAFHGSPHKFDKFTLDHIGTGEGAQAYGWGLYFAGKKEVAEYYREKLTVEEKYVDGEILDIYNPKHFLAQTLADERENEEDTKDTLEFYLNRGGNQSVKDTAKNALDLFNKGERPSVEYKKPDGQLYEVSIPEDDVLLSWDNTRSEQSETTKKALGKFLILAGKDKIAQYEDAMNAEFKDWTGEQYYQAIQAYAEENSLGDVPPSVERADEATSKYLNSLGVKGLKYFDGSSRGKGKGSHNYVIFDDSAIETIKTYYQNNRGQVSIMRDGRYIVKLFGSSNLSTFLHETGHIFLDAYNRYAEAPDAPDQFKTDMAGIFEYLGVKSYAEIGVEQHEKFARAFENYLRAGEAPSVALQSAFQKFKAWLSRIYQTIQELRAPVTPELKAIFDRMLATDEEISLVQNKNDGFNLNEDLLAILPKDAQERYRKLHNKALEQAKEKLLKKSLREKEREQTQAWKDERAKLRAEIELQVNTDPLYRTMEFLKNGKYHEGDEWVEMPPVKIARDDAIKHAGKTIMAEKMKGMTAKNGISADALSQMMGYVVGNGEQGYRHGTGQELLYTIANAEDRKARIERLTNETMIERHGDLMTDGTIEKAAIEAWNNDAQALKMEMEGKAAAQLAGLPFGSNTNFELAAQKILASKNVRDATNVDRFYVASVRAAKAYGKAIRSKNYPVAVKAKQQQLLSHHLYKQSLQARRALDKSLESWKRLQKTDEKLSKSMDLNYIYVARAILGRYGVLPYDAGNLQTYFAYIQQEDPEAYEDLILAVQENTRNIPQAETRDVEYTKGKMAGRTVTQTFQPWTKLSLEEFLALKDTIDNVLGVGRNQKVMTVDGQKIERQAVLDELQARLDELPETSIATGQEKALEWHDKGKLAISGIFAGMRRVENWVNVMDGQYGGVFRKYVWNPINDARGQYLEAKHEYLTKMAELLKPHDENLNGSGEIFAYEIGYKFHSKAELIGMILHMGNESNWYKLWKGGRGKSWNPENVQSMMDRMMKDGTITKTDMDLVQSMWDLVEGLKPAAQKAHRSMYGYYFSEVTSWPVPTPWGEYRGGYWPAIPDNNLSQDARIRQDKENLITVNNSSMFPSTGRGFTKSRSEGYAAPLSFDLRLLPSHVDKVLRFVHLETAVKDVAKLANDKKFRMAMDRIDPRAIEDMLIPWLQRVARQTVETNDSKWFKYIDPAARWLRSSTSAQAMMLNLLNAVQQVTGFAPAMYKVGARPLGRALVQYMKNPKAAHEKIYEASSFMRYRNTILADNMQKAVIDIVLDTSKYAKVKDAAQAYGYIFQKIFQSWVDGTTWMAAYDNALAKNMNEKEAVRYADSIVRETQGSTSAEDLSKFEAGPATMRLFTMFYSYFNTQGNLITAEAQNIIRSTSGLDKTKKLGYLYLMAFAVPSFMAELLVKGLKGDLPDDEDDDGSELDDWLAWFVGSQLRYATAMVPFAGQVINSAVNAFDDKPYNDKIALSPVVGMAETLARTPKSIYQAVTDDGDVSRAIQNTLTSLGFVTGLPLGQLGKPLGYAADVAEGDTEIDSPLDPLRGIVAGPPPADKR